MNARTPLGILVEDVDVIEDIAFVVGELPAAVADRLERQDAVHGPGDLVDAVTGLFDQPIAGQPGEVIPVADLPFDVAHAGGPTLAGGMGFHGAGQIRGIDGANVANGAVMDLLVEGTPCRVITPAVADHQRQVLVLGLGGGLQHAAHARGVGGHGFLAEHMLAGVDGRARCCGRKPGRGRQEHHVHAAVDHFLEGVQAHEARTVGDLDPRPEVLLGREVLATAL